MRLKIVCLVELCKYNFLIFVVLYEQWLHMKHCVSPWSIKSQLKFTLLKLDSIFSSVYLQSLTFTYLFIPALFPVHVNIGMKQNQELVCVITEFE
jgi:hypothetical protein